MSGEDRSGWKEMSTIGRKKGLECGTTEISRLFSSSIFTAYPFKGIWCIPYERMGRLSTCKQKFLHWQYYSTPAYLKTNTSIPQMPENHYQLTDMLIIILLWRKPALQKRKLHMSFIFLQNTI